MIPVNEQVRAFIVECFLFGDTSQALSDDASMIENDIVDSTGVLELVTFVEDSFGVTVSDAEILPANFDSISRIVAFVTRKLAQAEPSAVAR